MNQYKLHLILVLVILVFIIMMSLFSSCTTDRDASNNTINEIVITERSIEQFDWSTNDYQRYDSLVNRNHELYNKLYND